MNARTFLRLDSFEDRLVPDGSPLDLTVLGTSGTVNGALFSQFEAPLQGSGGATTFLRVQDGCGPTQQGYNSNHRPVQFNESHGAPGNHALRVSDVPTVSVGGVDYKEFLLDVNERHSKPLVSLDEVRLYVSSVGNLHGYNGHTKQLAGLSPVYDLDAGAQHWVKLNNRLNEGHGRGDMLFLVPASTLAGGEFVYLYSRFGSHHAADGGSESWNVRPSAPPADPANASVSGTIFEDLILNGVRDEGEPGLANMTVYIDANHNGVLDPGEQSALTADDGSYTITGLTGGSHELRIVLDPATGLSSQAISFSVAPSEALVGLDVGINLSPQS